MLATTTLSINDLLALTQSLVATNATYLGISVTIILFVGGLFYLLNFRPLQASIETQRSELENLRKEVSDRLNELSREVGDRLAQLNTDFLSLISTQTTELRSSIDLTKKQIDELKAEATAEMSNVKTEYIDFKARAEKELSDLKRQHRMLELDRLWEEHYMWDGRGIYVNSLSLLAEFMKKSKAYGLSVVDEELWLKRLLVELKKITSKQTDADDIALKKELTRLLDQVTAQTSLVTEIKQEIGRVFD